MVNHRACRASLFLWDAGVACIIFIKQRGPENILMFNVLQVLEAIQVGTTAIKENHVSLDEVQDTLSELDEAITLQREIEEAIGMGPCLTTYPYYSQWSFAKNMDLKLSEIGKHSLTFETTR